MTPDAYPQMRAFEDWHWWYRSLRRAVLRELGGAERILDVGCGTGGMFEYLRERKFVGIDISGEALSRCRERGADALARGDCGLLPFKSSTFDAVLCLDLVYHSWVKDELAALRECSRVLAPGGVLILQAPAFKRYFGGHDRFVMGVRRYRAAQIKTLVNDSGLRVVRVGYRNLLAMLMAEIIRKKGGSDAASDLSRLPGPLNSLLGRFAMVEEWLVSRRCLPMGLSVWCVATKEAST